MGTPHSLVAERPQPTLVSWLTGNVLLPALRAHFVRPKSLPAILSLRCALLTVTNAPLTAFFQNTGVDSGFRVRVFQRHAQVVTHFLRVDTA